MKEYFVQYEDGTLIKVPLEVRVFRDGNQFCAVEADFINLQESEAGFGDTAADAVADLYSAKPQVTFEVSYSCGGVAQTEFVVARSWSHAHKLFRLAHMDEPVVIKAVQWRPQ